VTGPGWPPEVPPPPWLPDVPRPIPVHPPVPMVDLPRSSAYDQLAGRLLERRIVLVAGHLDAELATQAAAQLLLLDADADGPIELHLLCRDGELDAALALADTVALVGVTVRAWCRGALGGVCVAPYAAASRRLASPHATFHLRDPVVQLEGRAADLASLAEVHAAQVAAVHQLVASATRRPVHDVADDFRAGLVLAAQPAVAYGLVHEVVTHSGPRAVR